MVDSGTGGAFHINTVLQSVSYQALEKGITSANTYEERRLWFRLRRARSHESAYEWHLCRTLLAAVFVILLSK